MPELPEVHTISNDLNKILKGSVITGVKVDPSYRILPDKKTFINGLLEQPIVGVSRVAKNIVITLGSGNYLIIHLAMTGQVYVPLSKDIKHRWNRMLLTVKSKAHETTISFNDMRKFGKLALLTPEEMTALRNRYGPEPIDDKLTAREFFDRIRSRRTNIKNLLLDQKVFSGLGNIYANDALFLAGIHPETLTQDITENQAERLWKASREILLEGIGHRGSTLSDKMYLDVYGKEGTHQEHFRVYARDTCPKCKEELKVIKVSGRGTYFCPNCQT